MKHVKHKKTDRRRAGFSLSETLLAVLLLAIIFLAATVGIRALYNAYQKITVQAEAQVLLSTAVSEITNDIHGVTQVKKVPVDPDDPSAGSNYQYFTTSRNTFISYGNGGEGKGITVISGATSKTVALLPDAANTQKLYTHIEPYYDEEAGKYVYFDEASGVFSCTVKIYREGETKLYESTDLFVRPYSRNLIVSY